MNRFLLTLLLVLTLCACAPARRPIPQAQELPPVPVKSPPVATPTDGSLWNDRASDMFTDVKARRIGDILTVAIYEQASASKEATTETGRASNMSADITKFFGMEDRIANIATNTDPAALISAGYSNDFKGSGVTKRKEDLVATLTTQVVEVLPNGNLRIEGNKSVTVNNETQLIRLTGLVRPSDVTAGNIVDSKYILNARIAYTGKGVISDKQRPGWLVRVLDNVWPF